MHRDARHVPGMPLGTALQPTDGGVVLAERGGTGREVGARDGERRATAACRP
jgi:hypothetical protein